MEPSGEDRDVGGAAPDVDHADTELALVVGQHRLRRGQRLEHDVDHVEPGLVAALDDVLGAGDGGRDDVDLRLEPHAAHAQRLADAVLVVDDELLRDHVDDLAVHRDRDGLGGVDHPLHVPLAHLAILHRHHSVRVEGADVAAGDAGVDRRDLAVGHQLRLLHGMLDGVDGGVDVDHHPLAQPARRMGPDAHHVDTAGAAFGHDGTDLGRADVETHDQVILA